MAHIPISDGYLPQLERAAQDCHMSVVKLVNLIIAVALEELASLDEPKAYELVDNALPEEMKHAPDFGDETPVTPAVEKSEESGVLR